MWTWIILLMLLAFIFIMSIHQRKIDKPLWDRIPELRKQISKAQTKEELIKISKELCNMVKGSRNEYLHITVNTLILVIEDRIEYEFKN